MPSLQLLGAVSSLHEEVWVAGCLFSGRQREARSVYSEPAVYLEYFIQHSPACVREPFSPLHSCRFTQQEPLHSE